jgi:hypothetical protein
MPWEAYFIKLPLDIHRLLGIYLLLSCFNNNKRNNVCYIYIYIKNKIIVQASI